MVILNSTKMALGLIPAALIFAAPAQAAAPPTRDRTAVGQNFTERPQPYKASGLLLQNYSL